MNTLILSTKVFLISAGILSLATSIKLSFPVAMNEIPVIWSIVMSWLKPPYLYLIINGIIITIAATYRFHQTHSTPVQFEHSISVRASPPPNSSSSFSAQQPMIRTFVEEPAQDLYDDVVEVKPVIVNGLEVDMVTEEEIIPEIVMYQGFEKDIVTEKQIDVPQIEGDYLFDDHEMVSSEIRQLKSLNSVRVKPFAASRFGKRKPSRTNPQVPVQKSQRVPRPPKHDTLENIWKMINEGRFNKSDTFEQHNEHVPKSETYNYPTGYEPSSSIRKEPSPDQEELNKRFEEFIKKTKRGHAYSEARIVESVHGND